MARLRRSLAAALTALLLAVSTSALPAAAVEPDEVLSDPALEARARNLSAGLRCLVCQNQSIDDSNAPLARDLRLLVRERIKAGDGDEAVTAFIVARYGEFVLLRPPLNAGTMLLWLAPVLLLAGAGAILFRRISAAPAGQAQGPQEPPLSEDEKRRLAEILKRGE